MKKPELVMPAGSLEKLKYAFAWGADAVYVGLPDISLRARLNYFDINSLREAIVYSHSIGKKIYIAINIIAHERDIALVEKYVKILSPLRPDAFIISDPGILKILKRLKSNILIHLSTQANTTNSEAVSFWKDQGVKRIILARELSFNEIGEITEKIRGIEIEIFVHGAMCMSYSGRCFLSNFLTGRDSNRGECTQPCRWSYYLVEEARRDELYEIVEEQRGSYILNSKDLCLIDKINILGKLNIDGYKVEGRTKNIFYVSLIARAYRNVIDKIFSGKMKEGLEKEFDFKELEKEWYCKGLEKEWYCKGLEKEWYFINLTDNHGFTHGFTFKNEETKQNVSEVSYKKQNILGLIDDANGNDIFVKVKNPISVGDKVTCISPDEIVVLKVYDIHIEDKSIKTAYGSKRHYIRATVSKKLGGDKWKYGIVVKSFGFLSKPILI